MSFGRGALVVTGLTALVLGASACGTTNGASVVRELGEVKERMDEVDREIAALQRPDPATEASVRRWTHRRWTRAVRKQLREYGPLREDALALEDEAAELDDRDVQRAAALLVRMIDHRRNGTAHLVRSMEQGPSRFRLALLDVLTLEDESRKEMDEKWADLAARLSDRYGTPLLDERRDPKRPARYSAPCSGPSGSDAPGPSVASLGQSGPPGSLPGASASSTSASRAISSGPSSGSLVRCSLSSAIVPSSVPGHGARYAPRRTEAGCDTPRLRHPQGRSPASPRRYDSRRHNGSSTAAICEERAGSHLPVFSAAQSAP